MKRLSGSINLRQATITVCSEDAKIMGKIGADQIIDFAVLIY